MMAASMRTRFTQRYGVPLPIVQAGMAFASMSPTLPVAIAKAGGIGSIANIGFFPPPLLQRIWAQARDATDKPLSINLITSFVDRAIIDTCVALKPCSVSFHWGRPSPAWVAALHNAGVDVWEQVGCVAEATRAMQDGIDVIIAQGSEAGGHNYGETTLLTLLPQVRDAVGQTLVLASGGIVDGRGIAAALMLGADGVWMGTRFLVTHESDAHPTWKDRIVQAGASDTVCSHVFGRATPDFNPMRVLRNGVVNEFQDKVEQIPADNKAEPIIGTMNVFGQDEQLRRFQNLAPMTSAEGDFEELPLLCGEGVGGINDILSTAELMQRLTEQTKTALAAAKAV